MAIQTSFAEKVTWSQDCNHRFLALLGNDGELDLALLDVKNRVRDLSLRKNNLILPIFGYRFSLAHLGEKFFGIKRGFNSLPHKGSPFFFSHGLPFLEDPPILDEPEPPRPWGPTAAPCGTAFRPRPSSSPRWSRPSTRSPVPIS